MSVTETSNPAAPFPVASRSTTANADEQGWHDEPPLREMLNDPIVRLVLTRDRLRIEDVQSLVMSMARRLIALRRGVGSVSAEGAPDPASDGGEETPGDQWLEATLSSGPYSAQPVAAAG